MQTMTERALLGTTRADRLTLSILRLWYTRLKTRQRLRELDARALADVGISEPERRRECAKRFWQD